MLKRISYVKGFCYQRHSFFGADFDTCEVYLHGLTYCNEIPLLIGVFKIKFAVTSA